MSLFGKKKEKKKKAEEEARAYEAGNIGPLVEALPKEYAMKRFPDQFDEHGNCKSNVLEGKLSQKRH